MRSHTPPPPPSTSSSSSSSSSHQYKLLPIATLALLLLSAAALLAVTAREGLSLPHLAFSPSSPESSPPPVHVLPRGGDVTLPPTPNPASVLFQSQVPIHKEMDHNLGRIELSLSKARSKIKMASRKTNRTVDPLPDPDYSPRGHLYLNANAFHRSYLEMEKTFKVYVYEEGEPPIFHDGPCKSIYSTEGRFIFNMEIERRMRTRDPLKAHAFFLPFSILKMIKFVREANSFEIKPFKNIIADYIHLISQRHPFWNRTRGSDHFMVSCHDWAPKTSAAVRELFFNSMRVLCNANTSEGFNPSKDISLPEMNMRTDSTNSIIGTAPGPSHRTILAFFAGGNHGPIRPALLQHWKGKDEQIQVYEYLPQGIGYYDMMKKSKFCLCPSGFEVASPRVVEAIYLDCVPVVISDHYALPFSDVLDWTAFSVQVGAEDIPNLKKILMAVPQEEYLKMHEMLGVVRRHFVVNTPPKRFDMFYMLLHSVWLRRINIRINTRV